MSKAKENEVHELRQAEKKDIFRELIEDVELSPSYVIQLTFASIIVILGLLIDSTAVVIGAMLIAPIFLPVLGIALGVISNKDKVLRKSLLLLGGSILGVFLMAYVITKITPIETITSEIIARANPTILDLFIALASAVVGILAYFDNKIASGSAGVAISISLLPPLATSGIAAAFGDTDIMMRSFVLFLANVGAIVFAGIVTLYVMNIRPRHHKKDQKRWRYGVIASSLFICLISIPLTYYFINSIQESSVTNTIRTVLFREITDIHPQAELEDVTVSFERNEAGRKNAQVKARLLLPEQVFLTQENQTALREELSTEVTLPVRLKFNVLSTLLVRENATQNPEEVLAQEIQTIIQNRFAEQSRSLEITSLEASENEETLQVDILVRTSDTLPTVREVEELESIVAGVFEKSAVEINMAFIPITTIEDQPEEALITTDTRNILTQYLPFVSSEITVDSVTVTPVEENAYQARIVLLVPEEFTFPPEEFALLQNTLSQEVNASVEYRFQLLTYR